MVDKSIKPNSGIFRRWSIVVAIILIPAWLVAGFFFYVDLKQAEYHDARKLSSERWAELDDEVHRMMFELSDQCPRDPDTDTCSSSSWKEMLRKVSERYPEAGRVLHEMDKRKNLSYWESEFPKGDPIWSLTLFFTVPLFLFWLLTAAIKFIFFGGRD